MADQNMMLKVVLEGLDKLTSPLRGITGASTAARQDLEETQRQIRALNAEQQKIGKFKEKQGAVATNSAAFEASQARLAELRAQMEATAEPTKALQKEFANVERQTAQLGARLGAGRADLANMERGLTEAGVDVRDLAGHENRLTRELTEANEALREQTDHLDRVNARTARSDELTKVSHKAGAAGISMIGAGVAIGAPVVEAAKDAMNLESAMADVRKVVTFETPEQFAQMSDDILDLTTRIPMAADGFAQIVAAAGRAGVPREELLQFAEDAAKMGVAFDSTAEEAGNTMAKWRTAFGLPRQGLVDLADQINALTNTYGGNVAGVTEMVTKIGPLGKVGGLAAAQIASMGQVLSSVGVEADVGATGIKNMMLALTKGGSATKSQSEAFKALGLDAVKVADHMQTDAGGAIMDVMKRIQALPKATQAGVLTNLFGSESVGAIAPMLTSLDQLQKNFELVGDKSKYADSMTKEYEGAIATTEGATGLAMNAVEALNIKLGQALLPTITSLSGLVKDASNGIRSWADEHPKLAKGIMLFLGVGAALLVLLGGVALAFSALTATAAALSIGLGPLLLIVAAVAALAAAAYLIYDNWGTIVAWFTGLWETIKGLFSSAVNGLINIFLSFTPLGLIISAFMPVLNYLRTLDFAALGRHLIDGLINGIVAKFGALKATVQNVGSSVTAWFKEKLGIHSPSRVFAGLGGFVMAGLDQGLAGNASGPLQRVATIAEGMTNALSSASMEAPAITVAQGGNLARPDQGEGFTAGAAAPLQRIASIVSGMTAAFAGGASAPGAADQNPAILGGSFQLAGLDEALAAGTSALMDRVRSIAAGMTAALAAGSIAPGAIAAAPSEPGALVPGSAVPAIAAAPASSPASAGASVTNRYEITIHAGGGSTQDIEAAVRRAIADIENERRGRSFGDED